MFPLCRPPRPHAAAQGLSIVVPVYNEAAGLALLHERLGGMARDAAAALRPRLRGRLCRRRQHGCDAEHRARACRRCARRPGGVAVAQFRQGSRADGRAGPCPARRRCCSWTATASIRPTSSRSWSATGSMDGYDVVYTAKAHRDNKSFLRRLAVHGFYALINWGARQKIPEDAGDFRLLSPRAAAALRQLPERNRFFKGLASWIGFRQIRVDYEPAARAHGVTTFSPGRLVGLVDRRPDVVLGSAAAGCEPARRRCWPPSPSCSGFPSCGKPGRPANQFPAIPRWWSA